MAEAQTQVKPEYIEWVKEEGVFRPARHEEFVNGLELIKRIYREKELSAEESIAPDDLTLFSSIPLGTFTLSELSPGWKHHSFLDINGINELERRIHIAYSNVQGRIFELAKQAASQNGAHYFAIPQTRSLSMSRDMRIPERASNSTIDDYIISTGEKYLSKVNIEDTPKLTDIDINSAVNLFLRR